MSNKINTLKIEPQDSFFTISLQRCKQETCVINKNLETFLLQLPYLSSTIYGGQIAKVLSSTTGAVDCQGGGSCQWRLCHFCNRSGNLYWLGMCFNTQGGFVFSLLLFGGGKGRGQRGK